MTAREAVERIRKLGYREIGFVDEGFEREKLRDWLTKVSNLTMDFFKEDDYYDQLLANVKEQAKNG